MPFVVTVDQRGSRRAPDRVAEALRHLAIAQYPLLRRFERTAGDEFQGVLDDPGAVVDVVLDLVRVGGWSVGVGIGSAEEPLPPSTRESRGPAFSHARTAVEAAKRRPQGVAVRGSDGESAADVESLLALLALIVQRRSPAAWQAVDLRRAGFSVTETAAKLGVSRQAVGQRLAAGAWPQEEPARPAAARLLHRALNRAARLEPARMVG